MNAPQVLDACVLGLTENFAKATAVRVADSGVE